MAVNTAIYLRNYNADWIVAEFPRWSCLPKVPLQNNSGQPIFAVKSFLGLTLESLGKRDFTLDEVYAFERHLGDLYPGNQNVKPKIRQQLQFLRDRGFIDFVSRGNYRLRT